jgi:hypothetical protein
MSFLDVDASYAETRGRASGVHPLLLVIERCCAGRLLRRRFCLGFFLFASWSLCHLYLVLCLLLCLLFSPVPYPVPPMAPLHEPVQLVAFVSALLVLLLHVQDALQQALGFAGLDAEEADALGKIETCEETMVDLNLAVAASLHCYRIMNTQFVLPDDLDFWVKPRSTAWFTRFVIEQYDDGRWVQHFRMTKSAVFRLSEMLAPHIRRQNTRYRVAIPVVVRVACTLFKLAQGASLTICSELFAVGTSTVSGILYDTVRAINVVLRDQIAWPTGQQLLQTQSEFKDLCSLPAVVGAIDCTHIHIAKPRIGAEDYFYFKSAGYTLNCQAIVDSRKRFLDLYLGMPGSTNDARVLRRSSLYRLAMHENLFDVRFSVDGFPPYLLGDSGYPLLPWLMTPHRTQRNPTVVESLYNRKLRKGRGVVENAFGILKQTWRELLNKTVLDVIYLPDVITACAILHNLLLGQTSDDVDRLLGVLQVEGWTQESNEEDPHGVVDDGIENFEVGERPRGSDLQHSLGLYLCAQRGLL